MRVSFLQKKKLFLDIKHHRYIKYFFSNHCVLENDQTQNIHELYLKKHFQTNLEGQSILFSVGNYDFVIIKENDRLKIKFLEVVSDTGSFETLLATPI